MAYRIQPLGKGAANLLTLQSIGRRNLFNKLATTKVNTILTTVQYDTHLKYQSQITHLKANSRIRFVPYYQPLVYIHNSQGSLAFLDTSTPRKISLLIGDNNPSLIKELNPNKVITIEEVCKLFPQKVPLSYRPKANRIIHAQLQNRLGIKQIGDRLFQFEHMLMIHPTVKMWDEAIQVILDCMPTPLYVPYLKPTLTKGQLYRLDCKDFLNGLAIIHKTVSTAVKTHPVLNIVRYDQHKQLSWLISHVATQTDQMAIDRNFFTDQPRSQQLDQSGRLHIVEQVESLL